ncbi:hypothetical protein LJR230_001072 [Trinickia sp. LjRoot230]|uniref:hypothetical protein n=1 Tax=Trinickia sp. LjRoot230 TaxID=3342288 RepID=UPI003ECEE0C9
MNEVMLSAKRAMQFLRAPHESEAERALLAVTTAFIRAGRDDLAHRASELAMDAR